MCVANRQNLSFISIAKSYNQASISRDVDQHFDLVMLSERMDESMVLMADVLCLPLEEVTSLKNNVRKKDKIQKMTDDEKSVIARFQRPDQGTCVQDHILFVNRVPSFLSRIFRIFLNSLLYWAGTIVLNVVW